MKNEQVTVKIKKLPKRKVNKKLDDKGSDSNSLQDYAEKYDKPIDVSELENIFGGIPPESKEHLINKKKKIS